MNYATAAASKSQNLTAAGPTAVRIGQVEQALGDLEHQASYLEKMAEQMFQKLSPLIPPVPPTNGDGKEVCGNAELCPLADRVRTQSQRVARIARAMEVLTEMVEL
jgi:hypothetical protein